MFLIGTKKKENAGGLSSKVQRHAKKEMCTYVLSNLHWKKEKDAHMHIKLYIGI